MDIADETSIEAAASIVGASGPVHLLIVATGLLHDGDALQPEKSYRTQTPEAYARAFAVNTIGPALIAKHFLPLFPREGRAVFACLSARVGSITDNRLGGWHAYRASKAALNMVIRNLSIELGRSHKDAIAVALHPGTVETPLSRPFQRNVAKGKLFTPEYSATRLLSVIDALTPEDNGRLIAWDGTEIRY
jgi:NAD(P)-dependent dehydrogenase (short-subunit alcohol dehydrogenase family)